MLSFLGILRKMIVRFTAHDVICKAATHPARIEHLIKQRTDLRKTSMALLFALMGLYISDNRMIAAGWTGALVLLTYNICSMYDYMDNEAFKAHIDAMGPAFFTVVSITPAVAVTALLSAELIIRSESPVLGVLQVIFALLPGLLPAIGEALSQFWQTTADITSASSPA